MEIDAFLEQVDRDIVAAHGKGDKVLLAQLYDRAADRLAAEGRINESAFFLVHAYVWALDSGEDVIASKAFNCLSAMGREC